MECSDDRRRRRTKLALFLEKKTTNLNILFLNIWMRGRQVRPSGLSCACARPDYLRMIVRRARGRRHTRQALHVLVALGHEIKGRKLKANLISRPNGWFHPCIDPSLCLFLDAWPAGRLTMLMGRRCSMPRWMVWIDAWMDWSRSIASSQCMHVLLVC